LLGGMTIVRGKGQCGGEGRLRGGPVEVPESIRFGRVSRKKEKKSKRVPLYCRGGLLQVHLAKANK